MKPTLQFRLSQHLTLTPQLQQSIRLLQLSTIELNQEIEQALMENPILEREEGESDPQGPPRAGDTRSEAPAPSEEQPREGEADARPGPDDVGSFSASPWRGGEDDEEGDRGQATPDTPSLRDHLNGQLTLVNLDARDRVLVSMLVDALNDDGYLTQPLEEIAAMLPDGVEAGMEELAIALRHLQNLEPAGIGARSPGECLALQLRAAGADTRAHAIALVIAEQHLQLLAARDYARLKALTGASEEELRAAQALIRSLNPRPGAAFYKLD